MGNYQEYLKKMNPLREVDETGGLRTQLFGNPYKLERQSDKVCDLELVWGIGNWEVVVGHSMVTTFFSF